MNDSMAYAVTSNFCLPAVVYLLTVKLIFSIQCKRPSRIDNYW